MNILEITVPIQIALQVGGPLLAGWLIVRRYGQQTPDPLRIFLGGAVSFAVTQFLLLALAQGGALLGLPAVPEPWSEFASVASYATAIAVISILTFYLVLRLWLREARSWADGIMLGIGYGATEAIFTGLFTAVWFVTMLSMKTPAPDAATLSAEEQARLSDALSSYWGTPWYMPLASAVQELLFVAIAVGLAALAMQAFLRRNNAYLLAAVGIGILATAAPLAFGQLGVGYSLAASAVFAALAMLITARLRPQGLAHAPAPATQDVPTEASVAPAKKPARKRRAKKP